MPNRRLKLLALLILPVSAVWPTSVLRAQRQPDAARTDVPVKTVMLFSSGVGYFEHAGIVRGNSATELRFKTTQINDILKSLVLQDENGGKVTAVTYASQDPLAKTLRSFQVDITSNPSLADLLNQLRGAAVTVQHQGERISGSILGVEHHQKSFANAPPVDVPVLNILTGASIHSVELQSLSSLSLDDAEMQSELTKALGALGKARDQDKKPVTINFTGAGDRHVRVGYVVETPVWKTSYRLLLGSKTSNIQGWAIVENQTDTDWSGITLSLVSGRPISFMMDLYQPLYLARPVVTQELFAGLRPQLYDDGVADSIDIDLSAPVDGKLKDYNGKGVVGATIRGYGAGPAAPAPPLMSRVSDMTVDKVMSETVQSVATAAKMGELFQYTIPNVTLARHTSAMLPIVTDSIRIERLSIYNASVLRTNPLNGVRLTNSTGKHLLQGPVTVLDNDRYAGDARIDNVPPGQQRLLSYGIDLELRVDDSRNTQQSELVTARIAKGLLVVQRKLVSTQEYLADNQSEQDKTLVVEHPVRAGWKLADTLKPMETTTSLYRFQRAVPARRAVSIVVKEQNVQSEWITLLNADLTQLSFYTRAGEVPAAVRAAVQKATVLRQAMLDTQRDLNSNRQQVAAIAAEQTRIRENMKTVGQSNDYYKRLLSKLNEQETTIETLQREGRALESTLAAQRSELEAYLSELNVE